MKISSIQKNTLRIFVVEPRSSGGMIHYAYQLCRAMAEEGADVTLITASGYEMENLPHNFNVIQLMNLWPLNESKTNKLYKNKVSLFLEKISWNIRRIHRGIRYVSEWTRLTSFLLKARPDIIQFGKIEFPFEAFFLSLLKRQGFLLSQICHEFELREQTSNPLANFSNQLYRWVYSAFSIIFFHAENNRQRFLSLFTVSPDRLKVIPHGNEQFFTNSNEHNQSEVGFRQLYGFPPSSPVVLFFGNLTPSKGIPDLLKAFAIVYEKEKNARLVIAGRPSKFIDLNSLKEMAFELDICNVTVFDSRYIPIEDVGSLMNLSSVVVYPYLNSTQSGSLQIAYSFARPVIATNTGGLPEAVDDGKSGFLVSPASPVELAQAILKFIQNPNLTEDMGKYAKELSETRFSWRPIAKTILTSYANIVIQDT